MRYAKILGPLAMAVAVVMTFAAIASATVLTVPAGTVYTGTVHATNELGHVSLHNETANIECASTFDGKVASHGAASTAIVNLTSMNLTGCTGGWTVTVNTPGRLEIHTEANGHGLVTWPGLTTTAVSSLFGITCRYATNNFEIGKLTPAPSNTGHATLDITGRLVFHGGGIFCGGAEAQWTGQYKVNTPTGLRIS